jgi:hypothetical protein
MAICLEPDRHARIDGGNKIRDLTLCESARIGSPFWLIVEFYPVSGF